MAADADGFLHQVGEGKHFCLARFELFLVRSRPARFGPPYTFMGAIERFIGKMCELASAS
jgi:hypothetical protein